MTESLLTALAASPALDAVRPTREELRKWYALMHMGRVLDDKAPNYLKQGLGWSYHAPCAGHDGIQVALGTIFRPAFDYLFPYYRDLTTCLAAGVTPEQILLNGMSKATDVASGGRHMSNHFARHDLYIWNVSSSVANHAPHAAGLGRAIRSYGMKSLVYCSMGESSTSEGYFYEAVNGCSLGKLPVIFVIQDNGYGISVPKRQQTANHYASDNFASFPNLKVIHCDGKDVLDSVRALREAAEFAQRGAGCVLVHADCVRIGSHSNSDRHELYRDEEELSAARELDPLPRFRRLLVEGGAFSEEEVRAIEEENLRGYETAADLARSAPDPDPRSIHDFVLPEPWIPDGDGFSTLPKTPATAPDGRPHREVSMIHAINETMKDLFRENEDTFIWGQDVASKEKGGIFNVTKGMEKEFGSHRVFNAPIAEDYILGTADGFSRVCDGVRVIVEGAEFADYFWPAAEQMVEMSHEYWRTNGEFVPNVTVRLASGGYIGGGLYHSQNIEGWLTTLPGIRIVVPAFADDAAGLLRTAVRSRGITAYLEPKFLYNSPLSKTFVPDGFAVPFGKARLRRPGKDLTVLAYGTPVHWALEAAETLSKEGKEAEVLDLRSLAPLDFDAIASSVKKTSRVLIVHEDKVQGGFGGELSARVTSELFEWLDAPVERVGSAFTPVGFNRILERAILPSTQSVLEAARRVLSY